MQIRIFIRFKHGDCFELSAKFVLDNSGWTLCHGIINPPTGPFEGTDYEHAWVEKGNTLYESIFNMFYKTEDYYKVYLPKVKKRYATSEVNKAVLKYENWGPW